jgi:hypothetical protein
VLTSVGGEAEVWRRRRRRRRRRRSDSDDAGCVG